MFTGSDFLWLYSDFSLARDEGNTSRINFLKDFVSNMNLELLDKYFLEELNPGIQLISKIYAQKGVKETYEDLRSILAASKTNKEPVNDLGLNDEFIEVIKNSEINEIDKSIK